MSLLVIILIIIELTDKKEEPKVFETSKILNTVNSETPKQSSNLYSNAVIRTAKKQKSKVVTPHHKTINTIPLLGPPITNKNPVNKKNYGDIIGKQIFTSLVKYNNDRKSRVIMSGLSNILESDFKNKKMITKIRSYFDLALKEKSFNSQIESTRMLMIDYLGDVILGNIIFEKEEEAFNVLLDLLKKDTINPKMDDRQKKSMIGDKMEMMAYYTQFAEDQAYLYLQQEKGSPYFSYLKTGFINGLYFKGLSKKELKVKMSDVDKI